jgi:protein-S-isoprenylcysteine O-methyltransferase Ste14
LGEFAPLYVLYFCIILLLPISDALFSRRARQINRKNHILDPKSSKSLKVLWLSIALGLLVAVLGQKCSMCQIVLRKWIIVSFSILLMLGGLILRWIAIITLGRSFSSNIQILDEHQLVRKCLYRYIRHPAYTGMVIFLFGWGLTFENWIGLLSMFLFPLGALLYRIRIEENLLKSHFGEIYNEYVRKTRALIPFVF